MAAAYLVATESTVAKTPSKQTVLQLGQHTDLPYFKAFTTTLPRLSELYALIDGQIERILMRTGWQRAELSGIPIFLGSTGYVIADCEARLACHQPLPDEYSIAVIGDYLRERYRTEVFSFATSCTSAAQGVGYAVKMLKNGLCDKALVIGFELFNRLTFEHFHAMHLLSSDEHYLPFVRPGGIVLGEGVACLALSTQPAPDFRCELTGVTGITDNENLTNNSGQALRDLLEQTCRNAGVAKPEIKGIKVHAVGGNGDQTEMQVLQELFPNSRLIPLKSYMGHTLGASGATETAFLLDCLNAGNLPDLPNNAGHLPSAQGKALQNGYYLSYFLGFGGSNIAWLMKWEKN